MPKPRKRDWQDCSLLRHPPADPDLRRLLSEHLAILRTNLSDATVRRTERCCLYWLHWCDRHGVDPCQATVAHAAAMAAEFRGADGWSAGTLRHFLGACRGFHEYLCDEEVAPHNPWRRLRAPRPVRHIPRVLRPEEIEEMAAILYRPHWRDIRDRAVLLFMFSTACRSAEVTALGMRDLDLAAGRAVVLGKGRKERTVYVLPPAVEAIRLYLKSVRPLLSEAGSGPVFLGQRGGPMGSTAVRDALIRAAQRAEVERHVHPHLMRHSAATALRRGGMGQQELADVLGHADLSTTQLYVHLDDSELAESLRRSHPLGRQGRGRPSASGEVAGA